MQQLEYWFDTDPGFGLDAYFTILSVRSIIAFFTFFGWTGVLVLNAGGTTLTAIGAASVAGLLAMLLVGYLIYLFSKLSQDGNLNIDNTKFKKNNNFSKLIFKSCMLHTSS